MFPSASPRGTLRVSGKQNSLFPLGPVIKCLLFDLEPTETICHITSYSTSVISNFSVIPIRWLLTVNSEMASFLFRSLPEDSLVFF